MRARICPVMLFFLLRLSHVVRNAMNLRKKSDKNLQNEAHNRFLEQNVRTLDGGRVYLQ